MPRVSRESAAQVDDHGPVEDRHEDVDGYTIQFVSFRQDVDGTPLMKGLPGDACPCPHWGYVLKGRVTYRFPTTTRSSRPVTRSISRRAISRSPMRAARSSSSARATSCTWSPTTMTRNAMQMQA